MNKQNGNAMKKPKIELKKRIRETFKKLNRNSKIFLQRDEI
jgi:hypothetical protein